MIEPAQSSSIIEITKAIIKFHSEVGRVAKNNINPHFKKKFGDLNAYLDVIKEPLAKCGLAIIQMPVTNGLITILSHESGEYLRSEMTIPNLPSDAQKVGAALTYMRRYMIASFLGLNAKDDDGNSCKPKEEPIKGGKEQAMIELKQKIQAKYLEVKEPSEELKAWVGQIDLHNNSQLCSGLLKIENKIKEQK